MKLALFSACDVASDRAAPRSASLRSPPGNWYAESVLSMQAFCVVGRMIHRSTLHHRPNPSLERSAKRQRRLVPVVLRTPAPAQLCRSASCGNCKQQTVHVNEELRRNRDVPILVRMYRSHPSFW